VAGRPPASAGILSAVADRPRAEQPSIAERGLRLEVGPRGVAIVAGGRRPVPAAVVKFPSGRRIRVPPPAPAPTRRCRRCHRERPAACFGVSKTGWPRHYCNDCLLVGSSEVARRRRLAANEVARQAVADQLD
jgi:hypothetical protein